MLKELIKIANKLDERGLAKEAIGLPSIPSSTDPREWTSYAKKNWSRLYGPHKPIVKELLSKVRDIAKDYDRGASAPQVAEAIRHNDEL